jgi:hypothetical protein
MASLRNRVITALRLTGQTSITAALRPGQANRCNDHELLANDFAGALRNSSRAAADPRVQSGRALPAVPGT